jgi:hypothetical protein
VKIKGQLMLCAATKDILRAAYLKSRYFLCAAQKRVQLSCVNAVSWFRVNASVGTAGNFSPSGNEIKPMLPLSRHATEVQTGGLSTLIVGSCRPQH